MITRAEDQPRPSRPTALYSDEPAGTTADRRLRPEDPPGAETGE